MRLLLASESRTRREMLAAAGVPFESLAAPLDEEKAKEDLAGLAPRPLAGALAEVKAKSVTAGRGELVIGADQVLETAGGEVLHKAGSRGEAREQLRQLGGQTHFLHSAAAAAVAGEIVWSGAETVAMTMRPFSEAFLDAYLDREWEHVRWNVGAYRIEAEGVQLFETIEGSHFAILGLPLLPLLAFLRDRGILAS